MKYILSEKLEVLSFRISSNELSYADKSKNLIFRNQIITTNTSSHGYFLDGRYFFYGNETDYKKRFIDFKTNKIIEMPGYIGSPSEQLFNGEIFVTHEYLDLVDFKQQLISYNIKTNEKKVVKENVGAVFLYNKSVIIRKGATLLCSLSLLTGEYEWEVDLGLESKTILQIYAVSGDILLVSYENPRYGLCGIDVHTGKVVWDIQPKGFYPYTTQAKSESLISIQTSSLIVNGIQIAVGVNIFLEIENISGKIMRYGTLSVLDNLSLHIKNFVLRDNYIYFTAHYQRSFSAIVIGVLDYETLALLWWEKVSLQADNDWMGHFLVQLQVSENRIYALDDMGTLHIYERDETIPFEKPTKSGLLAFEYLPDLPAQNIDNQNFNETDDLPF